MITGVVAPHTLIIVRAPLVDDGRGNELPDWQAANETPSSGWAVDAGSTAADVINRDGSSVEYTLRGPFAADVRGTDRVRLFGDTFEIEGGVLRQPGPSAITSHTIIRLIRWEG